MNACGADQLFAQLPQPKLDACRFLVPEENLEHFQAAWADRAAQMKQFPGFQGFNISQQSDGTWLTVSRCTAAPEVDGKLPCVLLRPWMAVCSVDANCQLLCCYVQMGDHPAVGGLLIEPRGTPVASPLGESAHVQRSGNAPFWPASNNLQLIVCVQGVFQFVPDKGAGFPEDFIPFKDLDKPVNAKY